MQRNYTILAVITILSLLSCRQKPYQQGKILYENFCSNCHMTDGTGLQNLIPPLNNPEYLRNHIPKIACTIRNGTEGVTTINGQEFDNDMRPILNLNDVEITNIINYLLHTWGETNHYVSNDQVKEYLNSCKKGK